MSQPICIILIFFQVEASRTAKGSFLQVKLMTTIQWNIIYLSYRSNVFWDDGTACQESPRKYNNEIKAEAMVHKYMNDGRVMQRTEKCVAQFAMSLEHTV